MKKRMLITGVSGLLGNNLAFCLKDRYTILGLYNSNPVNIPGVQTQKVDLTSADAVCDVINDCSPEIIIHCAAISDVEVCEANQDLARQVNVAATGIIVDQIKDRHTKLIFISSDMVYDDLENCLLGENDAINPPNFYGQTKYAGEQEALKKEGALIARTNFFGWNVQDKASLAEWVVNELSQKNEIQGFNDVYFSSLYTFDLAEILHQSIEKDLAGVYNFGSSSSMSKYEFAVKLAEFFSLDKALIKSIPVDAFPFQAKRKKNIALDVSKLSNDLNITLPAIEESLEHFYQDYMKGVSAEIKSINSAGQIYPQLDYIPYGRQSITEEDIQTVVEVLKSKNLTQGPKIVEFEELLSAVTDARFAVAVNSGTSALHIACRTAGVGPGDEVITSPNTFVASANCVVYCGATPVFCDIDPKTYNISAEEISRKISERTKAIIPVHFAGQSCDMSAIQKIVSIAEKKYGQKIYIIEDACHALGSSYKEAKVGSCKYSDMTVMSFHPVKHITTGEGGAVLTNNEELCGKLRRFRSHGITSDPQDFVYPENAFVAQENTAADPELKPWYYEQQNLGYNYRTTDINCALGVSQLKRLSSFIKRRQEVVAYYNNQFKDFPCVQIPYNSPDCNTSFHLYVLLFDFKESNISRAQFINELRAQGVQTQVHYIPVHTQPFYQNNFGTKWGDYPNTEAYYQKCLSIPLFATITDVECEKVVDTIKTVLTKKDFCRQTRIVK